MNVKIDTHKNHIVEKKLRHLEDWKISSSTKKEIRMFIDKARMGQVNKGKRLSEATISKYLSLLKCSLEIVNRPTNKLTLQDIEKYDKEITKRNLKSAADYRIDFLVFLRWKLGVDKANKIAGWLDLRKQQKTPDYLTEQEVTKLLKNCKNPSEKYLVSVLFDSGARAEEFLNIRYEDLQLPEANDVFVKIALKEEYSKTKGRTVSLYWKHSLDSIKDFLEERINQGIKSSEPVFTKSYDAMRMFIARLGKKVLNKEINPHLFRHSSATYYAPKLNRQELCYRYGWKFSSNMPDVYISRAGMESKQLDEKFKSTELEELQKNLDQEKLARERENDTLKKEMASIKESLLGDAIRITDSIGEYDPKKISLKEYAARQDKLKELSPLRKK